MEKLSIQILCFIFFIAKVWCELCHDESHGTYMECADGCCQTELPWEEMTCCDPVIDLVFVILIAVALLIAAVILLCVLFMKCYACYISYSHNEREVLIPKPK